MPSFPLEVRLNGQLGTAASRRVVTGDKLPEPVFPQHPEFLTDAAWPGDGVRHWPASKVWHAMRGWAVPWL